MSSGVPCVVGLDHVTRKVGPRILFEGVSLSLGHNSSTAIVGASGSGKSTLLEFLSLMRRPDAGDVVLGGSVVDFGWPAQVDKLRSRHIGIVQQAALLLESHSAVDNVIHGMRYSNVPKDEWADRARIALGEVGLGDKLNSVVAAFSGGERQRVCIARAICKEPDLLVCDEPTSSLDPENTRGVYDLLTRLSETTSVSIVIATHDYELAAQCQTRLILAQSQLQYLETARV